MFQPLSHIEVKIPVRYIDTNQKDQNFVVLRQHGSWNRAIFSFFDLSNYICVYGVNASFAGPLLFVSSVYIYFSLNEPLIHL